MRKKRKRKRLQRIWLTVLCVLILLAGLGTVMVWKVFVVKNVEVTGNTVYTKEQIEQWILNDEYSWNSLYVFFKNRFWREEKEIPFVDSMEVSLKNPQTVGIRVKEKAIIGYIHMPATGENAYFDKDGFVVEISPEVIEGTTQICGIAVSDAKLYEKLEIESGSVLRTLLNLSQLLKKYGQMPDLIYIRGGDVLLNYGSIQVEVGSGSYLNEKLLRMQQIMPQLEGMTGTLHLETWTEDSSDIHFRKDEWTQIPAEETQ